MVGEVNKIIFNMLISGRGVYLPEIGTLYIERQGAKKIADNKLLSPRNVVNFTTQMQATSLVDEITKIAGCDAKQAEDIYDRWKSKTKEGNTLTINGVGKLTDKSFTAETEFNKIINPKGVKTLIVRRKKSNAWLYILCGVCVVIALGIFGYLLWGDAPVAPAHNTPAPAIQTQTEIATPAEVTDSLATAESAATPAETTEVAQINTAAESSDYAHYVVMGIFANPENAERAVEQVKSKIDGVNCVIIPFKNKHMVTIFGSNSRAECNTFASSYRDIYSELWIYDKE